MFEAFAAYKFRISKGSWLQTYLLVPDRNSILSAFTLLNIEASIITATAACMFLYLGPYIAHPEP